MKFAHMSDVHIGGWREEKLTQVNLEAFRKAINICIDEHVGFILIAGDLFNTSLPSIDLIKEVASILQKVNDHDISVYIIPGSHDFSPSGKTMLDVLEKSGLVVNVARFKEEDDKIRLGLTIDKTGAKITGLYGKKGGLETSLYERLVKEDIENEPGFKIFMFHTLLSEFKPIGWEMVDSQTYRSLPKNFNYYAGGHPHFVFQEKVHDYGLITYPGALFPNNFKELEEFKHGGFYIVDDKLNINHVIVNVKDVVSYQFDADDKTPDEVEGEIIEKIQDTNDKIVTIRVGGLLKSGKPSDINFENICAKLQDSYIILRNTTKLSSKEFEKITVKTGNVEEVEDLIIEDYLSNSEYPKEDRVLIKELMHMLYKEKNEGENIKEFDQRVIYDAKKVFNKE